MFIPLVAASPASRGGFRSICDWDILAYTIIGYIRLEAIFHDENVR
jgi:hypothetical protein